MQKTQDPEVIIRQLRQQIEDLKFELEELKAGSRAGPSLIGAMGPKESKQIINIRDSYDMMLTEARFLWALSSGVVKDHFQLLSDMHSRAVDANFTKVVVCRVRKKLSAAGSRIRIKTFTGSGYKISEGLDELHDAASGWVIRASQGV